MSLLSRWGRLGLLVLCASTGTSAWAQTQVKPRVLLIVDTSGSMTRELTSDTDTGADGSNYVKTNYNLERGYSINPRYAYGVGLSSPANTCSNTPTFRGQDSRMYAAKQAVSNVVNGSGDVDWGLARYAGDYCDLSTTAPSTGFLLGCGDNNDCVEDCCRSGVGQTGNCQNGSGGTGGQNSRACRCQTAADCPDGYVCTGVGGRSHTTCMKIDRCDGNNDCAAGQTCNGSNPRRCTCSTDDHCRENEFCIGGVCLYDPNLCQLYSYGSTDLRGINSLRPNVTCYDKDETGDGNNNNNFPFPVLPITYAGSCGASSNSTALDNTGCGSIYTCTSSTQCETGRACSPIPGTLVPNSGASGCTCATNADCDGLPAGADGRVHVGYTCVSGFCTYSQTSCRTDGAVRIVDPRNPNSSEILEWLNNREDYTGTNGAFLTAGNPVATINVADPELRASGLTPVGGSLRSAAAWYRSIKAASSDPQLACRPYITVILTDGVDTCEGNNTQEEWGPPAGARKFVQETVANARVPNKVYVIGLSVTLAGDRDRLNAVATAGGTGLARFVSSSAEIEAALADILAESILFERCDGVDNDCDGLIDEGFGVFEECTPGATRTGGTCNGGRWTCTGTGQSTCSAGYVCDVPPFPVGGSQGFCTATCTAGQGACLNTGVRECVANGSAQCAATALPAPGAESTFACNNRDDDCDGYIDDCIDGSPNTCSCGGCTGTPEICNGLDDDCDGNKDEASTVDEGLPCGTGACAGTTVCSNRGTNSASLICNGPAGGPETCNNVDDDCDGVVDSFSEACPPVSGQCDPGIRTCTAGVFSACTGIVNGTAEICNNIDDDCDGTPDDNVTDSWLNMPCCPTGNNADCCSLGTYVCTSGAKTCQGAVLRGTEVCDGVDNDCNGTTDDVAGIGQMCTSGSVVTGGTCTAQYVCTGTPGTGPLGLTCQQVVGPTAEVCNGLDDDCDGTADNNVTSTSDPRVGVEGGAPCMALPDGQKELPCMPGVTACVAGEIVCQGYVGPQPNLCDGVSRDCTGMPNTNGDCPAGFECYQGNCVTPCGMGEFPCQGGFVCDPTTKLCIPDVCNKANCPPGQICELADDGSAVCKDPCENITCSEGATCVNGVCSVQNCKSEGCPTGQICQGTPPECVPDPCAGKMCEANEYCNPSGECERICEDVCLSGTVCIDGMCETDPCSGKNCPAGQVCVLSGGMGVCVESFCGNDCGTSNRVCCGGTCRPDPCSQLQCPANTVCQLDPACGPQCVAQGGGDPVQIVGAGGGGVGCAAGGDVSGSVAALLLVGAALALMARRRSPLRVNRVNRVKRNRSARSLR